MGYDCYVRGADRPEYEEGAGFDQDYWSPRYYLRRNIWGMGGFREQLVKVGAAFEGYEYVTGWEQGWAPAMAENEAERTAVLEQTLVRRATSPVPDFPTRPQPESDHFDDEYQPVTDEARAYVEEVDRVLRWRPEGSRGIPLHKLGDNSGWIVTAEECREALEAIYSYRAEHGELPDAWADEEWAEGEERRTSWDDVLPFLESAAAHDGFEVR